MAHEVLNSHKNTVVEDPRIIELAAKYNKGDSIPVSFEPKNGHSAVFDIVLDGVIIGGFTLLDPQVFSGAKPGVAVKQLGVIKISDSLNNKGIGKKIFIDLNKYVKEKYGCPLDSGEVMSHEKRGVWASLEKDGLVVVADDGSYRFK